MIPNLNENWHIKYNQLDGVKSLVNRSLNQVKERVTFVYTMYVYVTTSYNVYFAPVNTRGSYFRFYIIIIVILTPVKYQVSFCTKTLYLHT